MAQNPSAGVPLLTEGDFQLSQSLAIIDYLDATHPEPRLIPAAPPDRARVLELSNAIACDIHPVNNMRILRYLQEELGATEAQKNAWYPVSYTHLDVYKRQDRGSTPVRLNVAITSYLLSVAVFVPVSGWAADRYGARRVFIAAIGLFTLSSVAVPCLLSLIHIWLTARPPAYRVAGVVPAGAPPPSDLSLAAGITSSPPTTSTLAPARRRSVPSVTTRSPGCRPSLTATMPCLLYTS